MPYSWPRTTDEIKGDDFGYPGLVVKVWDRPDFETVKDLAAFLDQKTETDEAAAAAAVNRWTAAVSKVIISTNIEGADFSTPETVKAILAEHYSDCGWLFTLTGHLLARWVERAQTATKKSAPPAKSGSSGHAKKRRAARSPEPSVPS